MRKTLLLLFTFSFCILYAQEPKLMLPIGHTTMIETKDFSPDGKKIVTASEDGTAKLWDTKTGLLLSNMNADTGFLGSSFGAHFSPNSKRILTYSKKSNKLWNAETGDFLINLTDSAREMVSQFSADGEKIVTPSGYLAIIRNCENGKVIFELKLNSQCIEAKFSPDGKKILTTEKDSTVRVWSTKNYELLLHFKEKDSRYIRFSQDCRRIISNNTIRDALTGEVKYNCEDCIYWCSPDGEKILGISENNTLVLWDLKLNKTSLEFKNSFGKQIIEIPKFSPDGRIVITQSREEIIIWNAETGLQLFSINKKLDDRFFWEVQFSQDGKKIITKDKEEAIIWQADGIRLFSKSINTFHNPLFSPDGKSIVADSAFFNAIIINAATGELLNVLGSHTEGMLSAQFSPNSDKIVTGSENSAKMWDASSGKLFFTIKKLYMDIFIPQFSHDGKKIVIPSSTWSFTIWDALKGNILFSPVKFDFNGELSEEELDKVGKKNLVSWVVSAQFSPDDQMIVAASAASTAMIWDLKKGKFVHTINHEHQYKVHTAQFSTDGKRIVTASEDGTAKVLDVKTQKILLAIRDEESNGFTSAQFSNDGKKIVTASYLDEIKTWNAVTGKQLMDLKGHSSRVFSAMFSPDMKTILSGSADATAKLWDAFTGKMLLDFKGHTAAIRSSVFSPNGKRIITASDDGTVKLWDAKSGKNISTFIALDSSDYFVQLPDNWYLSSPNASKLLHYVTPDLKVIAFEQLDVKYNRPDLVLQAIGNTDTGLIKSYKKAYEKRIQRLGFDTSQFKGILNVPEADFVNRDKIEYKQTNDKVILHIDAKDSTFTLDRFNLWINEVPLFGAKGISLKDRNKKNFDTTLTVTLSDSINRIETSVTNISGLESYRMPLQVMYSPQQKAKEKLYFVGIGIDRFKEAKYNLQYSVKDIRNLAENLKKKYGDNLVIVDTLFDKRVTDSNIIALKRKLLDSTKINDKVILSYSGHGMLSDSFDYYLSTHHVNFQKPEEGGLPYDALESLLDGIPARKKLMFIDACHSGEVDKEEMAKLQRLVKEDPTKRGTIVFNTDSAKLGMKNSFELMQELFVNVGRSSGATIISAAGGMQLAQEGGGRENGVFTWSVLEYMDAHPSATVTELKNYVNKRVPELTKGLQQPTTRTETLAVDWRVW